jgi:methionyl-tRNA formyltransferase
MQIVFFGTSSFAARILVKLLESSHQVLAIVTRPDRVKGRHLQALPPPVKETASQLSPHTPLFQPEKASAPEFASTLTDYQADLFVVVAYGEIIKKNLLEMPRLGCINIHASLLPKFRGAAPIQRSLMAGEKETGITIIEMVLQMDAGDILAIESIPVDEEMTFGELEPKLCELGIKLLFQVLEDFKKNTVSKVPQDHALATLAPKLTPEDEKINWSLSASHIHNQIRALSPSPSAWCQITLGEDLKRLKIKKAKVVSEKSQEGWVVPCGQGALELQEVQLEGKKAMSAQDFLRGLHTPIKINN